MSEKLFLIVVFICGCVSAIAPCFFGMSAMTALVLSLIPMLLIPTLRLVKN